jgi:hypothetical protein
MILALDKWLTDNNWIGEYGSHDYSVITIPTAVSAASKVGTNDANTLIKFHSGVWKFEVSYGQFSIASRSKIPAGGNHL